MATWEDFGRIVKDEFLEREGIQVFIKTDLGPAIMIYDSDAPVSNQPGLIKGGVEIRERDGDVLTRFGDWPQTNYIKAGVITVSVLSLLYIIVQGIKKQVTK